MGKNVLKQLGNFKVLTFDCYGTLIDWEAGIWDAFQPLITGNGRSDILRGDALDAFATFESRLELESPGMPYPEVLKQVHNAFARRFGLLTTASLDKGGLPSTSASSAKALPDGSILLLLDPREIEPNPKQPRLVLLVKDD